MKGIHGVLLNQKKLDTDTVKLNFKKLERILLNNRFTPDQEEAIFELCGNDLHKFREYLDESSRILEAEYKQKTVEKKKIDLRCIKKTILFHKFPKLIKDEIAAVGITQRDTVLFIGSGAFPLSAMIYNKISGCTVNCLEIMKDRVKESRELMSTLGLKTAINIQQKHGQSFKDNNYTAVVVALQIENKKAVLEHIAQVMPSGTLVLCRVQSGLGTIFNADQENMSIYDMFDFEARVSKADNIITTLILRTK